MTFSLIWFWRILPIEATPVLRTATQNCPKLQSYVTHAKRLIVTGAFLDIFTYAFTWVVWNMDLSKNAFHVMPYPVLPSRFHWTSRCCCYNTKAGKSFFSAQRLYNVLWETCSLLLCNQHKNGNWLCGGWGSKRRMRTTLTAFRLNRTRKS